MKLGHSQAGGTQQRDENTHTHTHTHTRQYTPRDNMADRLQCLHLAHINTHYHGNTQIYTLIHTYTHTHRHTCTHTNTSKPADTHTFACTYRYIQSHTL